MPVLIFSEPGIRELPCSSASSSISRVLHYLKVQKALATLVIPFWPSSSFWPLITCTYAAAVQGYVLEDGCRALIAKG